MQTNKLQNLKEQAIMEDNENNSDVIDTEEYNKKKFFEELNRNLDKSEDDLKNGRICEAREVFRKLREKYGY